MVFRTLVVASLSLGVSAGSMYLAQLCRGHACDSAKFPMLDYVPGDDGEEAKCICRAHPCWDDAGSTHACSKNEEAPFLVYSYDEEGKLSCGCNNEPYIVPVYIAKELCPGHHCGDNPEHPILDYNAEEKKCLCRAHPCHDDNGVKHMCPDGKFPLLQYGEDEKDGEVVKKCLCKAKLEAPKSDEL